MKILKFEDNDKIDKALATLIDCALKSHGIQALSAANTVLQSLEIVEKQEPK